VGVTVSTNNLIVRKLIHSHVSASVVPFEKSRKRS
jgi:hypothetical protein